MWVAMGIFKRTKKMTFDCKNYMQKMFLPRCCSSHVAGNAHSSLFASHFKINELKSLRSVFDGQGRSLDRAIKAASHHDIAPGQAATGWHSLNRPVIWRGDESAAMEAASLPSELCPPWKVSNQSRMNKHLHF